MDFVFPESIYLKMLKVNFFLLQHENKCKQVFCSHVVAMSVCVVVSAFRWSISYFHSTSCYSLQNQWQNPKILKSFTEKLVTKQTQIAFFSLQSCFANTHTVALGLKDYIYVCYLGEQPYSFGCHFLYVLTYLLEALCTN